MTKRPRRLSGIAASCALGLVAACGGGGSSPAPDPIATTTITITAAGVNPKSITVTRGSQVTFINNDTRSHNMESDPHPEHDDCPELEQVGFLSPGDMRTSGNLNIARTCKYHDHDRAESEGLRGTIVVQ